MLCNYGAVPENFDTSKFTGLTLTPANDNADSNVAILSDVVKGKVERQVPIDLDCESVEEVMADLYPPQEIDKSQIPLTEDGEIDIDELPDLPEDYQDKLLLVNEDLMDSLEENLEEYPYSPESAEDDYYDDNDDILY